MSKAQKREQQIGLAPLSLKNAPAFIERQFPVGRLSAEAYKERKANLGQTLTALGSYWKGRKPLVLVRAVVLGCLLPATDDPAKDLDIFLTLMAMDDEGLARRVKDLKASDIDESWPGFANYVSTDSGKPKWLQRLDVDTIERLVSEWFPTIPYEQRIKYCLRPEELDDSAYEAIWPEVNSHLGTDARSLSELVEQLGIARFGHRPKVADTFCGGGSIPFEAARIGCDAYASDLNPIACMLTWGAFNIIGADVKLRGEIEKSQRELAAKVDAEITKLGIEHDSAGNRAKSYLYCVETRCPKTGWMVPMSPSWVISRSRNVIAKLVPDHTAKRYEIEVLSGVSEEEMAAAEFGTVVTESRGKVSRLVHPMNPETSGVEIKTVRGDHRNDAGEVRNRLRPWGLTDFVPRPDDTYQERLYCIHWITRDTCGATRQETFFSAATADDLVRERKVEKIVRENIVRWQSEGRVPDMAIEFGDETTRLLRERGWTHWHHLFGARDLLNLSLIMGAMRTPFGDLCITSLLNHASRLCQWITSAARKNSEGVQLGGPRDLPNHVFYNQSLNLFWNYATRASSFLNQYLLMIEDVGHAQIAGTHAVSASNARDLITHSDFYITDPPYADAVNYHEITEFFIAWLRKNAPDPFNGWEWSSRRDLAIKGKEEDFRRAMVDAYAAMTRRMADNGMQVVMFTHQNAGVWADLGAILWAAGLRVTSAWNIVTETTSALKEGNYVQGTICLVLRKRLGQSNARRMEIEAEIEEAVKAKLTQLHAIDEEWRGETLYTDGDLTLAAYAAALEVVTGYTTIDRQPLDRDLYRKLEKGERTMLRDLIDYAESVANNLLVPTGFPREMWRDLVKSERYYVRMLDMEAKGATKVADFQNFAKSFAFADYADLMASTAANNASLAGAADLKGSMLDGDGFAQTLLRKVLFAVWKTIEKEDPKLGVTGLKTELADYWQLRQKLIALADYVALKTKHTRPEESSAAHELSEALKVDRV